MPPTIDDFLPEAPRYTVDWEAITEAFPWIAKLRCSTQDPLHHAEGDVHTHVGMVVRELAASAEFRSADPLEQRIVFAAALLHDVCKPETRAIDEEGRITNKHHSRMGANEARQILWRMGWLFSDREKVCAMISAHQVPFWLIEKPEWQATQILAATSLQVQNRLLAMLAEADARGRLCQDQGRILDNIALFKEVAKDTGCYSTPFPFFNDHARLQFFRDPEHKDPLAALYDTTDRAFTVTVMSGLPGSGKSTWIASETAPGGALAGQPIVSMDRLRIEMKVRPEDNQGAVRQAALKRAKELLAAKTSFVWDGLNLDWMRRQPLTALCDDYGARISFAYVEVPPDDMFAQNRDRKAQVPVGEITKMLRKWDPPTLTECHDLTLVIRNSEPHPTQSSERRR
jgi:putative nucleotidyltransferase with HDIG domain